MPEKYLAEFALLQVEMPGGGLRPWAVLLLDPTSDRLHVRSDSDYRSLPGENGDVVRLIIEEITGRATQGSGTAILAELEDSLSNALRITDRRCVSGDTPETTIDELYQRLVRDKVIKAPS